MMIAIGNWNLTYLHFSLKLIDLKEFSLGLANYLLINRKVVLETLLNQKRSRKSFNSTNTVLISFLEVNYDIHFLLAGMLVLYMLFGFFMNA